MEAATGAEAGGVSGYLQSRGSDADRLDAAGEESTYAGLGCISTVASPGGGKAVVDVEVRRQPA